MGETEKDKAFVSDNGALKRCEKCDGDKFQIWVEGGIWYALCVYCLDEYGLFPIGTFRLLRSPQDEIF